MSETANNESTFAESLKPVQVNDDVKFPPFPDPTDEDFDEDISEEERNYYRSKFQDLNIIKTLRLHCTACDRHLGCAARNESRMRSHPLLRTLVCHTCHTFYNSGEFEKGDDGSELYCRWCGQGGQVYCCSDCPHVFCAKCIKRNLGAPKIKEIENTDDWKCFKCNNKSLWDLRALCWALLRFCDLKNKITYKTQDSDLKEVYQKNCAQDLSECCKGKSKRKEKLDTLKKKEAENSAKKSAAAVISKMPPTIQVKKFASINVDDSARQEKKAQKRPASPKNKFLVKNPMSFTSCQKYINPVNLPPLPKKIRMPNTAVMTPMRFTNDKKITTYTRIRPKQPQIPIPILSSNQFNNMVVGDNINLSLESLTQGLDMAAVATLSNNNSQDAVVCTPDFPLEPLCEVTEDNTDDDVQCITPGPVVAPKVSSPPPLVPRLANTLPDLTAENIVQMTENDVTVNAVTGGLKFRVDPQTLSSNKMYRLPDGRIFAINANPNMPGGYSATIVAVTENATGKIAPKGATYAAKLSAVSSSHVVTPPPLKVYRQPSTRVLNAKHSTPNATKVSKGTVPARRECDLNAPVEWYRYNLIDAVDALDYSLSRLRKLKKEATTMYLRTRSVGEMRNLHKTFERLLNTSSNRFHEIRDNLNKGLKQYLLRKMGVSSQGSEDDDDVEILPDMDDNDDPIFIDENSVESNLNAHESQEVDLTGVASSDHNDSTEKSIDKYDSFSKTDKDPLGNNDHDSFNENSNVSTNSILNDDVNLDEKTGKMNIDKNDHENENGNESEDAHEETVAKNNTESENIEKNLNDNKTKENDEINGEVEKKDESIEKDEQTTNEKEIANNGDDEHDSDLKNQDTEMSEEMIETLLKDDDGGDNVDNAQNTNCLDIAEPV